MNIRKHAVFGLAVILNVYKVVAAAPPNDQCSGAVVIPSGSTSFDVTISTSAATSTGDPSASCISGFGNGIWYQFTPPLNGVVTVTTVGSDFDTGLAIYAGSCGSLIELDCNDDYGGGTNRTSGIINVPVIDNRTVYVLAGGYNGARGNLSFHFEFTSDDQCSGAIVIPVQPGNNWSYESRQSTVTATSTGDPSASCVTGFGKAVWYEFTPLQSGRATISTAGSDFDTGLAVYTGTCGSPILIACNDDYGAPGTRTSQISLSVSAHTRYRIAAGGYNGLSGNLVVRVDFNSDAEVAWVEEKDLTEADYQTSFNRWTGAPYNLRLKCVTTYDIGSGPRYGALWEKAAGPGYYVRGGMTATEFNSYNQGYQADGFQPTFISGFASGGVHYYNAIWTYLPQIRTVALVEMTSASLSGQILGKAAAGFDLDYVTTFGAGGSDWYAAVWVFGSSSSQCVFGRTSAQYQSDFNSLTGQGYRLAAVSTAISGGTPLYSAVFRPPFGQPWYAYGSISPENSAGETLNAYYTGFRPSFVSVYTENNAPAYNNVWTLNGGPDPSALQPIYNIVNAYLNTNSFPGMTLAISRNGRLLFAKGFGVGDQAANEWVHPDNLFRVASVSKIMTAVGVLRLRDGAGGTLDSLDNTVFGSGALLGTTYGTTAYSSREQAITVRELLSHTTGWTNDGVAFDPTYDHAQKVTYQLDNVAVSYPPGTFYQYENMNFIVAARVIEQLSGLTYGQYIKNQVLAPCGITAMQVGNKNLAGRYANEVVYYQNPMNPGDPYYISPFLMDGSTAWVARPIDLLLLMRRIDGTANNADIISSARFSEMMTGNVASVSQAAYGLANILGGSYFGHNGGMAGTRAWLYHRTDGFDVAFACNSTPYTNDGGSFTLKANIDSAINAVPLSAWPDYDLFNSVNTAYDNWAASTFPDYLRAQLGMKADFWGPEADPDGDGIANLLEAYFQYDPFSENTLPYVPLVENGDFVVRWTRGLLSSLNGVQLIAQFKTDLASPTWQTGPAVQSHLAPNGLYVIYETRMPVSAHSKVFQRFQAIAP